MRLETCCRIPQTDSEIALRTDVVKAEKIDQDPPDISNRYLTLGRQSVQKFHTDKTSWELSHLRLHSSVGRGI